MPRGWIGAFAAAASLALGGGLFVARLRRGRMGDGALVAMRIERVAIGGSPPTGVVMLGGADGGTLVPLFVSPADASRLEQPSEGGLAGRTLEALGARLSGIVLDRPGDAASSGRAEIEQGGQRREVRGSTGDLLDWAVRLGVPIWVTRGVIAQRGLSERQLREIAPGLSPKGQDEREPALPEPPPF